MCGKASVSPPCGNASKAHGLTGYRRKVHHIFIAILQSVVECQRTEYRSYANFHQFSPKIGYHSNVPLWIAKTKIDHAHPYVYLS